MEASAKSLDGAEKKRAKHHLHKRLFERGLGDIPIKKVKTLLMYP